MNDELLVYLNGLVVPQSEARVSVFDAGFQSGDGVWEGLRVYNGVVFELDRHLARLYASAKSLAIAIPLSADELSSAIHETLRANHFHDDTHIRLMVTRGVRRTSGMDPNNSRGSAATVAIIAERKPVPVHEKGIRLQTVHTRRPSPDVLDPGIHHANQLNSILAKIEANALGVDGGLMLDRDGFVAETDSANIFMVKDGQLATPRPLFCLHGITRSIVLSEARTAGIAAAERDITLFDLYSADEVFTTGTLGELTPVSEIDRRQVGDGGPGIITKQLHERYRNLTIGVHAP
ncbi:MAG: aminotransferase class IV [Vulcanimicrobiaceae bacterium]